MMSEADIESMIEAALEAGYRPEDATPAERGELEEYAWGIVPCPHCDTGFILGVHDPDGEMDGEVVPMAILSPPSDEEEE